MIAIYVRESSEGQRDNYRHDKQLAEGLKFAESQGEDYKIYDEVKSGKDGSIRPRWEELKRDIRAGSIDTLFFWEYKRLGRDNEENEAIKKLLLKHNVKFFDAKSGWRDLKNHGVQLLTTIEGKQAEIDNESRREATIDGLHQQFDVGERRYSGRLYGYYATAVAGKKKGQDHIFRTWHIQEEEAKLIRYVFELAINEKLGLSAICRRLYSEHYRNRDGKVWTHDKIRLILRHPQYCGLSTNSSGEYIKSEIYPKIIEREQWELMQRLYPEYVSSQKRGKPNQRIASGIIECAHCQCRYTHWNGWGQYKKKDGTISRYDKVTYNHNGRFSCGGQKNYEAVVIEMMMKQAYYEGIFHSDEILKNLKGLTDTTCLSDDIDRLERQVAKNNKAKDNLLVAVEKGLDMETVIPKIKSLESDSKELTKKITQMKDEIKNVNIEYTNARVIFSTSTNEEFQNATEPVQNKMLKQIITKVVADKHEFIVFYIDGSKRFYNYKLIQKALRQGEKLVQSVVGATL